MNIRVLVVEDNKDSCDLLNFYLQLNGFQVIVALNGQEAIELAESEYPHIILMDLNLPVLDGWQAIKTIHQNQSTSHIPIIAISANCTGERGDKALEAGAVHCVQKPINIETIPDLIFRYAINKSPC